MKIKILSIMISLLIIANIFVVSATFIEKKSNAEETITINVALFTDEEENEEFHSPYRRTKYFVYALRNYSWIVGDTTYKFEIDLLNSKMLRRGKLTVENYDLMIYPPDQVDNKSVNIISKYQPRIAIERRRITDFVEQGGGYFGTCAGGMLPGNTINDPVSFVDYTWKAFCFGFSEVDCDHSQATLLFSELRGLPPEALGYAGAYLWYSGWNQTDYASNYYAGIPLDIPLNKDNPIFEDYIQDTCRIRWVGGPALVLPEDPVSEINVLARYPDQEFSDNESTDIHYWSYQGGIRGLLKGLLFDEELHYFTHLGLFLKAPVFASDWIKTEKIVKTNFSNRPFMVSEIYPNENEARIVRCTGHPEHNVWWGGHIQEKNDTNHNNLYEGFYRWENVTPEDETVEDEFNHTHWIVRRSIAWSSKNVPDSDLPPVYGESEVCDFDSDIYSLDFNVTCNVKTEEEPVEIDLYYRHSANLTHWSEWMFYDTDNDSSNGFVFNFDSPNGTIYYEFYSIRRVILDEETKVERVPPGADSQVYVLEG